VSASQLSVSSQDYIRLLEPENLAFFSQLTCFFCDSRLWRNGYRYRQYPVSIKLVRLKCRNSGCNAHYTVYPYDVLPRYRHKPEIIFKLTSECLKESPKLENALRSYQHRRERRIEDGEDSGPDVSTLRGWLCRLSDPASILSIFLSARQILVPSERHLIMVVLLVASFASQLLTMTLEAQDNSSPITPVTSSKFQDKNDVVTQNDLNFYNQEHPP
jgi:hypothetical protein